MIVRPRILAVFEHRRAIRAAVKGDRFLARRIPDEIGIHHHVVIRGVELRQTVESDFVRPPFLLRELGQRICIELQGWRDLVERRAIELSVAHLPDGIDARARFLRELTIGDAQTALRFANNVGEVVFERDRHPPMNGRSARRPVLGRTRRVSFPVIPIRRSTERDRTRAYLA